MRSSPAFNWREMSPKIKGKGMELMYVCDLLKSLLPTYEGDGEGGKKERSYRCDYSLK